jgi:hypothetical protein
MNSQSSVDGVGLSLEEKQFPTKSLTWKELLTCMTTCLFNHGPNNLILQPIQLNSCKVRIITTTFGQHHSGKTEGNNPITVQVWTQICKGI